MVCGRSPSAMMGPQDQPTPCSSPLALTANRTVSSALSRPLTASTATKNKADDFQPGFRHTVESETRKRSLNQRLRGADEEIQFHRRSTNSNLNREREPGLNGTKHDYTFSIRVHNGCFTGRTGRNYGCASSSSLLFVTCIVCRVSARSRQVSELVP